VFLKQILNAAKLAEFSNFFPVNLTTYEWQKL